MSDSKKILVCESNASLAGMMVTGLTNAGFACTVVDDGRDVWATLEGEPFDAVITEYDIKDGVGTQICRGLREHKTLAALPLIVTIAPNTVDAQALQDELKLEAAIQKPLSVKGLVASITSALGG